MRNIVIHDPLGLVIKFLINAILWYKCLIQRYIEIPNFLLILGILLISIIFFDCKGQFRKILYGNPKSEYFLFLYIILTFTVGVSSSVNLSLHLTTGLLVIELFVISLLILYYIRTRGEYQFIINNYLILFGIMTFLFILNPVSVSERDGGRFSLNENLNSNSLALYISMFIFSLTFFISNGKIKPSLGFALIGLAFYAIFLTGSRKGFINALIFFGFWIFRVHVFERNRRKLFRIFSVGLLLTLGAYILLPYFFDSSLWVRLNNLDDNGNLFRRAMYEEGTSLIVDHPLTGLGFDGFRSLYGTYSHSTFIEVFVSSGIPIGLLYFMALTVLFSENRKLARFLKKTGNTDFLNIEVKIMAILFFSIVISLFYFIHIYELLSFYNLILIMAPLLINRPKENMKYLGEE